MTGDNIEKQEWNEDKAKNFASIYLLHQIDEGIQIPVILDKNYQFIEPLLDRLHSKNYIRIANSCYQLDESGQEVLQRFLGRYREYLRLYDIFSAVNLDSGEFAFARYFDFESDEAWYGYLDKPDWADLRIAVARLKKLDAHEVVFMSFLNEGRFGSDENGWQFDLILGSIWDEIRQVCRNAITVAEVGGEQQLVELVRQGSALMIELLEHEQKLREYDDQDNDDGDEVIEIEEFYPYRDPFYISPFWATPLFFF